jgi:hypothetical protein
MKLWLGKILVSHNRFQNQLGSSIGQAKGGKSDGLKN